MSVVTRAIKSFGRFWWNFLVGDTPEITVAVVVVLGLVAVLSNVAHQNALAYAALPTLLIAALGLSLTRARGGQKGR